MPCEVQTTTIPVEIQTAIIGVLATILGTVLGWFLNNLSNMGKLNIYISTWKDEFKKNDAGEINPARTKKEIECYGYSCSVEIYNSSGETRIMRDVSIIYCSGKTVLKVFSPSDDSTRKATGGHIPYHYDSLGVLNIPPKSVIRVDIHNEMWDYDQREGSLDFLWKATSIKIRYKNENNQVKTKKIKDIDFLTQF